MNINLGMFDLALALSASKINAQFGVLYNMGKINRKWLMMCDEDGKHVLTPKPKSDSQEDKTKAEKDFYEVFNAWKNYANDLNTWRRTLDELDTELKIAVKNKNYDKASDLLEQQDEIKNKMTAADIKYGMYAYAIDAQLDVPQVDIVEDLPNQLLFNFYIKSGKIYHKKEHQLLEYDLSTAKDAAGKSVATKYAFMVNVANLKLEKADMITTDEYTAGLLKEISDDMFRIESLLLDFQNSNVALYSEENSIISDDIRANLTLQVVVSNYFSNVGTDKDSPFILGYCISAKPTTRPSANALFQPTSATYSSTFSNQKRASSFNFLMQTGGKDFPTDHRKKILPSSLIEQGIDKSSTINGVFGIDYSLFKSKYIDNQLIPELFTALSANIRKWFPQYSINEDRRTDSITFGLSKEKERLNFYFKDLKIESSKEDLRGIEVYLEWSADASLKQVKEISGFGVEVTQIFSSTSGIFGNEGKTAKNGKLGVLLTSGTHGGLVLNPIIDTPILGKNTPGPQISGIPKFAQEGDIFKQVLTVLILAFMKDAIFMDEQSMRMGDSLTKEMEDFKALNTSDFSRFSNKVIFPGTNVFTFENIRLFTGQLDDQDAILLDIAYVQEHKV